MGRSGPLMTALVTRGSAAQAVAGRALIPTSSTDFSDILGDFFGFGDLFGQGPRRRNRPQRGEDIRYDLEITFEDAMRGMSADIQVPRLDQCTRCNGKGAEPEDGLVTCPMCPRPGRSCFPAELPVGTADVQPVQRSGTDHPAALQGVAAARATSGLSASSRSTFRRGVDNGTRLRLSNERAAGPEQWSGRRPVRRTQSPGAPDFRAPGIRPALHGAGEHRPGVARHRGGYPDVRRGCRRSRCPKAHSTGPSSG